MLLFLTTCIKDNDLKDKFLLFLYLENTIQSMSFQTHPDTHARIQADVASLQLSTVKPEVHDLLLSHFIQEKKQLQIS